MATADQESATLFSFEFTRFSDQYEIPDSVSSQQLTSLLSAFYSHAGYECEELTCMGFSDPFNADQKVLLSDSIESCKLDEVRCDQIPVYTWAAEQTTTLWSMFDENPENYYPVASVSDIKDCSNELAKTDAIFCPYYSYYAGFDSDKVANSMALVELYAKIDSPSAKLSDFYTSFLYSGARQFDDLVSKHQLHNILPALPVRPSSVPTEYTTKGTYLYDVVLNTITPPEWGTEEIIEEIRKPFCETYQSLEGSSFKGWDRVCAVFVLDDEMYECRENAREDFLYGGGVCRIVTEYPTEIKDAIWKSNFEPHGFSYAYDELGVTHKPSYPITITDRGCGVTHGTLSENVLSSRMAYTTPSRETSYIDGAPEYLMRYTTDSISGSRQQPLESYADFDSHCTAVLSLAAVNNGAKLKVVNDSDSLSYTGDLDFLSEDSSALVSVSSSVTNLQKNLSLPPNDSVIVNGAGNANENWTNKFSGRDFSVLERAVIVGASINSGERLAYFTATPGDSATIQSRWIVAVGVENIVAGSVANTVNSLTKDSGTSFATPIVSRALNLAKSYCENMTYKELSDVILDTADRSMEDYSPERWGMGLLDVKAMFEKLKINGCQAI
ncbi:hypothetical protein DN730_03715 [Marinomonas piezotolerans]|uniref:Peptidase S8/S53 domain-containing protein n=1 Tax=Marinomonas piezotolerans TaxID=2213058 RepID=A0A370UEE6_9GAMM|nr:S8 family serine peptidase [Marinomonas piezotolerans]RDL46156.1 hypothetical protein DN730_03715 [Marinomonas piezotolerans]